MQENIDQGQTGRFAQVDLGRNLFAYSQVLCIPRVNFIFFFFFLDKIEFINP